MNLIELCTFINDEEKAESYLREIKVLHNFEKCIYCSSSSLGFIRRGKIRCYKCKSEWNRRKGSTIEGINLQLKKVILFLKLVELRQNNITIEKELNMNRITVKKLRKMLKNQGWLKPPVCHF